MQERGKINMKTAVEENEQGCLLPDFGEKIALIMPVYNEADTIDSTVREIYNKIVSKMGNVDVWVFEDGSTDGTKEVLEKLVTWAQVQEKRSKKIRFRRGSVQQ